MVPAWYTGNFDFSTEAMAPMDLALVSFNYKHTPLEWRERLAVPDDRLAGLLREARGACGSRELMVLSTCNRVEFYLVTDAPENDARACLAWIQRGLAHWDDELQRSAVILTGEAALTHLFRVACSLESMVIGEPQILGQVKQGYQIAAASRAVGPYLNGLMQTVLHVAKRVRSETGIARFPVSVGFVAAELAGKIFDSLEETTVMVIGAGEMAELIIAQLRKGGIGTLLITNRTFAHAVALAEKCQGRAVRFEHLSDQLAQADIVISSTGAPGYVIDQQMAREALRARKGRPMFFVDIAVPRDVDPLVNGISDVYCYDIDDLQEAADANRREREREALRAQRIIDAEVARFLRRKRSEVVTPVIKALRTHFAATGQRELDAVLNRMKHLPERDAAAVRKLVRSLVKKLLHSPSIRLREMGEELDGPLYAHALSQLFDLDPEEPPAAADGAVTNQAKTGAAETGEGKIGENVLHLPLTRKRESGL